MTTSGLRSAIHRFEMSKPSKTGFQYGVCVLPWSNAAPIAGTCEQFTLAMTLATLGLLRLAAVAFDRPAPVQHHVRVLLLRGPRHERGHMLEGKPVRREKLRQEIDIAAVPDHAVPVALEDRIALFGRHRKLLEVGRLVRAEFIAVRRLHEAHAEHVEVIALARPLHVEERRS